MLRDAYISSCGSYRYALWRCWKPNLPTLNVIGVNPSTADGLQDDPTIRRVVGFADTWGFGSVLMTNLFAYRATDPMRLLIAADPVGPENDVALVGCHDVCSMTVAAWGVNGSYRGRDREVRSMLAPLHHLGLTKSGAPKHPLYLKGTTRPALWK